MQLSNLKVIFQVFRLRAIGVIAREITYQVLRKVSYLNSITVQLHGYKMYVPLRDNGIGRALYVLRGREEDHRWMMYKEVNQGDTILDVGANIGYYALMEASLVGKNGKVYAIEPDPRNIHYLALNRKYDKYNTIQISECALSSENGIKNFWICDRSNLNSFRPNSTYAPTHSTPVQVYDFGQYINQLRSLDLVRMDVEGHELEIFSSLVSFANHAKAPRLPKKIIFETHDYAENKQAMKSVLQSMFSLGYQIKYLSSADEGSDEVSAFRSLGYFPFMTIQDWKYVRGLYQDIRDDDAAQLISEWKGTRTAFLALR